MKKLNLSNLVQDQIKTAEADKIRGGICVCSCSCVCPAEYRFDIRGEDKLLERGYIA